MPTPLPFTETGLVAHSYLLIAAIVVFFLFFIYALLVDHNIKIIDDKEWVDVFERSGLSKTQIEKITHDDDEWYFDNRATCIGYGDWSEECMKNEHVCSGSESKTFGTRQEQANRVANFIKSGKRDENCPLVYF